MGSDGAAGAEGTRMRWDRSGRRKLGWTAVAVAIALVGHALLMAGGGHPAAAHRNGADLVVAPAASAHLAAASSVAHDAPSRPRSPHHAAGRPPAAPTVAETEAATDPSASEDAPAGDPAVDCGGIFVLAWPQSPAMPPISGAASAPPSLTADLVVSFDVEPHSGASWLDPTAPSGNRRALLQVYRL